MFRSDVLMRSPRSRSSWIDRHKRNWLALLILVYAWGFFGTARHEAVVSHAVCEHGLLVHVEHDSNALPDATLPHVPAYSAGRAQLGHDHVHCTIAAPFSLLARSVRPLGEGSALLQPALATGVDQTLDARGFPLYLLAPSHSPPVT